MSAESSHCEGPTIAFYYQMHLPMTFSLVREPRDSYVSHVTRGLNGFEPSAAPR